MTEPDILNLIPWAFSSNKSVFLHGTRVAKFACAIAHVMGLSTEESLILRRAAVAHDIGKCRLPEEIVNKPGARTDQECACIRMHPEIGYELLSASLGNGSQVARIGLQHHERLDGSGYPAGLTGGDIDPLAKVVAVADVFDTMVYTQVYRPELPVCEALSQIRRDSGVLFDPEIVSVGVALVEGGIWRG